MKKIFKFTCKWIYATDWNPKTWKTYHISWIGGHIFFATFLLEKKIENNLLNNDELDQRKQDKYYEESIKNTLREAKRNKEGLGDGETESGTHLFSASSIIISFEAGACTPNETDFSTWLLESESGVLTLSSSESRGLEFEWQYFLFKDRDTGSEKQKWKLKIRTTKQNMRT